MKPLIDWLLSASPWVEYHTRRDLLGLLQRVEILAGQTTRVDILIDTGIR